MELAALGAAILPPALHGAVRRLVVFLLLRPQLYNAWLRFTPKVRIEQLNARRLKPFVERGLDLMWQSSSVRFSSVELTVGAEPGVKIALYTPRVRSFGGKPTVTIIHAHQGGFFYGGLQVGGEASFIDLVFGHLLDEFDLLVIDVGYKYPPEAVVPAAVDDVRAALRWTLENARLLHVDPARVFVCGESSGGCVAAAVGLADGHLLRGQLLLIPLLDNSQEPPTTFCGYGLDPDFIGWCARLYTGGDDAKARDPLCSPLLATEASVSRCPATLIVTNTFDALREQAQLYALKLAMGGRVAVTFVELLHAVHHTSLAVPSLLHEPVRAFLRECAARPHAKI